MKNCILRTIWILFNFADYYPDEKHFSAAPELRGRRTDVQETGD
jgi:hypothetical protein